ncbi:WHIM2 domain [Phytophthora cactorum]|nr:WHIM2 domain [Phytophthora cactorum]
MEKKAPVSAFQNARAVFEAKKATAAAPPPPPTRHRLTFPAPPPAPVVKQHSASSDLSISSCSTVDSECDHKLEENVEAKQEPKLLSPVRAVVKRMENESVVATPSKRVAVKASIHTRKLASPPSAGEVQVYAARDPAVILTTSTQMAQSPPNCNEIDPFCLFLPVEAVPTLPDEEICVYDSAAVDMEKNIKKVVRKLLKKDKARLEEFKVNSRLFGTDFMDAHAYLDSLIKDFGPIRALQLVPCLLSVQPSMAKCMLFSSPPKTTRYETKMYWSVSTFGGFSKGAFQVNNMVNVTGGGAQNDFGSDATISEGTSTAVKLSIPEVVSVPAAVLVQTDPASMLTQEVKTTHKEIKPVEPMPEPQVLPPVPTPPPLIKIAVSAPCQTPATDPTASKFAPTPVVKNHAESDTTSDNEEEFRAENLFGEVIKASPHLKSSSNIQSIRRSFGCPCCSNLPASSVHSFDEAESLFGERLSSSSRTSPIRRKTVTWGETRTVEVPAEKDIPVKTTKKPAPLLFGLATAAAFDSDSDESDFCERGKRAKMALADIMSVEMSAKYMDSSSSSSLSSESDDLSSSSSSSVISSSSSDSDLDSDTPRASVRKKAGPRVRTGKRVDVALSDYGDDSDLDSATSGGRKKAKKKAKPAAPRRSPTKKKKVEKLAPVAAPPSLPPPPPPPSPPPAAPDDSSSNSSLSDSSSSDSSDLSDSETPLPMIPAPPPPPSASSGAIGAAAPGATTTRPPKRRAASKKKVSESPSSLKVTLKLPPGFIANSGGAAALKPSNNNSKPKFQVTNSSATARMATSSARKAKPVAVSRSTKKKQPAGRTQGATAAVLASQVNGSLPTAPPNPIGPPVLPKLIPTGPTVPAGEIRGARELSFVDPALVGDHPEETIESNIPAHFDDPYAHGGDILRLLDMFFFCDENGYVTTPLWLEGRNLSLILLDMFFLVTAKQLVSRFSTGQKTSVRKLWVLEQSWSIYHYQSVHSLSSPFSRPGVSFALEETSARGFFFIHSCKISCFEVANETERQRQSRPSARIDSRNAGLPSDVVELMRTDHAVEVNAKGTSDELNLMECGFRHPDTYARARVWLPEITDWCLDYAEGDPTLWVITPHAWYKIAGPLSGLLPHPSYRHTFKHVRYLFEASYLVAYVLKEWLPINKKVSYRATLQQIIELSLQGRYRVVRLLWSMRVLDYYLTSMLLNNVSLQSAWFLVKNYPFIRAQISNLFTDKDTYLESMFFKQLHRLHENYTLREARHQKEMAEREVRRVKRENERLQKKQRVEDERQRLKDEREEERKLKEEELKYPVEDLRLLEGEAVHTNSLPLSCSGLKGVEGPLLGELIMAWQTICTFKDFVGLESISLEALVECITARCDEGTDVGLTRIFMAFLRVILAEKSFMSPLDDLVVEGNIKVSDLFVNSERTYGICERGNGDMLNAVTWQEILRQLMAKDLGIDPSLGHVEPLVGCEIVRQTLYMQNNSGPFNAPVDTSLKGLEDYAQTVKNPMDLGTIKKKIDSGGYEGPDGYENFAEDIRLVWDNAVLYNGEESDVGRAALALSDVFEQDYERFVVGRVRANQSRIEGCEKAKQTLQDPSAEELQSFQYADVVYGLYCSEFHELPTAYKIGALSWICSEFLTLSSIRTYMASQVDQEMLIYKNYRKRAADLDSRRKNSDKMRRERDNAFRKDCANQGIHPNSHNVFSEGIKRRHEFIGKFFEDLQAEKIEDEKNLEQEKKTQAEEMASELSSVVIRESPLGRDRYHNSYYMFKHDTKPRLFIERGDSGDFVVCMTPADVTTVLEWLNPKGVRELDLLTKLEEVKDRLLSGIEVITITDEDRVIKSQSIARKMLLCLKQHLENTNTLSASWEGDQTWSSRVEAAKSFKEQLDLFAELENAAVAALNSGVETIRPSWQRKRHEWRLALEGSCTYAQLVFLLHLLLEEFLNVEAFMDLHIRLDRREWLKLRPKETRNFIPEVGKTVVYFGDGHALALKEDEKSKRKRFTQKNDTPVRNATVICTVEKVSYHHGGGDPYALAVLKPISDMPQHECIREPGTLLCPLPSRDQRLARVFLRVLAKLKMLADAGPFLEPVSDREFPQYKEIILHPMDLGKMTMKASKLEYKNAAEFMTDLRLMRDNCQLFCEGRFPTLPPLAHNLVYVADGQIKKWAKEIRACEVASDESSSVKTNSSSPEKKGASKQDESALEKATPTELPTRSIVTILRLENRLPEYVVDISRYSWAVNRTWLCGEKFRMLFRDPQGQPGEYYGGVTAGSLPFDEHGMLPWESLRITWDEDDGSDDNRINPWYVCF